MQSTSHQTVYTIVTCTPHFKSDADNAWVTRDGYTSIHYWFNPGKAQTLLEVLETIEAWTTRENEQIAQNISQANNSFVKVKHSGVLQTFTTMEIRGVTYDRDTMAGKYVSDCFHDGEPITLRGQAQSKITVKSGICCTIL